MASLNAFHSAYEDTDSELHRITGLAIMLDGVATEHLGGMTQSDPRMRGILALTETIEKALVALTALREAEWDAAGTNHQTNKDRATASAATTEPFNQGEVMDKDTIAMMKAWARMDAQTKAVALAELNRLLASQAVSVPSAGALAAPGEQ